MPHSTAVSSSASASASVGTGTGRTPHPRPIEISPSPRSTATPLTPRVVAQWRAAGPRRLEEVVVHARDHFQPDLLRAHGFTLADVGATAEAFGVHLRHHGERAPLALGLALRHLAQVRDLRAGEQ